MGTRTSSTSPYTVDTKGHCFLCLRLKLDEQLFRRTGPNGSSLSQVFSVKKLSSYLNLNLEKVFNIGSEDMASHMLDKADLLVSLCRECLFQLNQFVFLQAELERIQNRAKVTLQAITNIMKDADGDPGRRQEYHRRLMSSNPVEIIQANIAEKLRREMVEKCSSQEVKNTPPKKLLQTRGLSVSVMPARVPNGIGMHRPSMPLSTSAPRNIARRTKPAITSIPTPTLVSPTGTVFNGGNLIKRNRTQLVEVVDLDNSDTEEPKETEEESEIVISSISGANGLTITKSNSSPPPGPINPNSVPFRTSPNSNSVPLRTSPKPNSVLLRTSPNANSVLSGLSLNAHSIPLRPPINADSVISGPSPNANSQVSRPSPNANSVHVGGPLNADSVPLGPPFNANSVHFEPPPPNNAHSVYFGPPINADSVHSAPLPPINSVHSALPPPPINADSVHSAPPPPINADSIPLGPPSNADSVHFEPPPPPINADSVPLRPPVNASAPLRLRPPLNANPVPLGPPLNYNSVPFEPPSTSTWTSAESKENDAVKQSALNEADLFLNSLFGFGSSAASGAGVMNNTAPVSRSQILREVGKDEDYIFFDNGRCKCQICGKILRNHNQTKEAHKLIHENRKPLKCIHCPSRFRCVSNLKAHIVGFHRVEMLSSFRKPEVTPEVFKKIVLKLFRDMKKSDTGDGSRPWRCRFCPRCYTQKTAMESHIIQLHFDSLKTELQLLQENISLQELEGITDSNSILPTFDDVGSGTEVRERGRGVGLQRPPSATGNVSLDSVPIPRLKCRICRTICEGKDDLKRHYMLFHGIGNPATATKSTSGRGTSANSNTLTCPYCSMRFRFQHSIRVHVLNTHRYEVFREYLPVGTTHQRINAELDGILAEYKTLGNNTFGCSFCPREFTQSDVENRMIPNHLLVSHFGAIVSRLEAVFGIGIATSIKKPRMDEPDYMTDQSVTTVTQPSMMIDEIRPPPPRPPSPPSVSSEALSNMKVDREEDVVEILPD